MRNKIFLTTLLFISATSFAAGTDSAGDKTQRSPTYSDRLNVTPPTTSNDVNLIRDIRQRLNSDVTLSSQARNVNVTSSGGRVILRGFVANNDEKSRIEEIVKGASGTQSVDNQISVSNY